jgi:hypothetical protein
LAQLQEKDLPNGKKSLQKSLELGLRTEQAAEAHKALDGLK